MRAAIASASHAEAALLEGLLRHVPSEVLWVLSDARSARERCASDPPDVLLVCMSAALDGPRLVEEVMAARPCAVVVLTDDLSRDVHQVYAAMAAGAVDAETLSRDVIDAEHPLVAKLRRLDRSRATRRGRARPRRPRPMLAIGASTGGPEALARVLCRLPHELKAPVLLAQHIEQEFLPGLSSFLTTRAGRAVEMAEEGALLEPGRILIVRSDVQATVDGAARVRYHPPSPGNPFMPCIDTLFESLARAAEAPGVAALLTGMGADGAAGLLSLRRNGWITFAQDAQSSVVFGMPKAAAELGAATRVVALDDIAGAATTALGRLGREHVP